MKSFFDKLSRKSGTGKEKQTKEGPALVPKAVGGGTRRRNATTRRSSSHFLSSMLIKAASSMLDHSSPGLRNVLALSSSLLKKSKLLKIPLMSLLAECSYTSLLSFAMTLVLILLTLRYLHFLHAKSDMTRRRDLRMFQSELRETLAKLNCGPIMLRLAWSDCATFDKSIKQWPQCGGATATIRFEREFKCTANAGLSKALDILQGIRKRYKTVSWADAIQMAGALAVEIAGGPSIPMRYGRIDAPDLATSAAAAPTVAGCPLILSTRLPSALPPFPDNAPSADVHIRNCFYRMGFSNRDIVALCGAHTLGRAFKDRSGACPFTSGDQGATSFTRPTSDAKVCLVRLCNTVSKHALDLNSIPTPSPSPHRATDLTALAWQAAVAGRAIGSSLTTLTLIDRIKTMNSFGFQPTRH